jgi:FG-GAP-like repeat
MPAATNARNVVYFNGGGGNFPRKVPWGPPQSSIRALTVADFDGDGHLDIAACHEGLGCCVYFRDGKGNFDSGIRFDTAKSIPYSMIAADLDGDGRVDVVVARSDAPCFVMFNRPSKKSKKQPEWSQSAS